MTILFRTCLLVLLLISTACNQSVKKVKVLPYKALHNNNSKVWILQMQKMDGQDVTPETRSDKIVMTLYDDQTFMVQPIKNFAYYSPNTGSFRLSEDGEMIHFNWTDGSKATYQILQLDENIFEYKTLPNPKETQQHLKFVPIDKPQTNDLPQKPKAEINIMG